MILPDRFIDHDKPSLMYKYAGLDAESIENKILDALNSKVIIKKNKLTVTLSAIHKKMI